MKLLSRTVEQKTSVLGFPKPGEFIEMTGTHMLEASDRAVFNLLYQHAHDSGRLLDSAAEWEIPLLTLRQAFSKHDNNAAPTNELPLRYEFCDETRTSVSEGDGSTPCRQREPGAVFPDSNLNSL
jgi:hypothetical protein